MAHPVYSMSDLDAISDFSKVIREDSFCVVLMGNSVFDQLPMPLRINLGTVAASASKSLIILTGENATIFDSVYPMMKFQGDGLAKEVSVVLSMCT